MKGGSLLVIFGMVLIGIGLLVFLFNKFKDKIICILEEQDINPFEEPAEGSCDDDQE